MQAANRAGVYRGDSQRKRRMEEANQKVTEHIARQIEEQDQASKRIHSDRPPVTSSSSAFSSSPAAPPMGASSSSSSGAAMDVQADRKRKADEDLDESGGCIRPDGDDRSTKRDREEDEQMDVNAIQKVERTLHDYTVCELFTTPRMTSCPSRAGPI